MLPFPVPSKRVPALADPHQGSALTDDYVPVLQTLSGDVQALSAVRGHSQRRSTAQG